PPTYVPARSRRNVGWRFLTRTIISRSLLRGGGVKGDRPLRQTQLAELAPPLKRSHRDHGRAGDPVGGQIGQGPVRLVAGIRGDRDREPVPLGQAEELLAVTAGVRGDAAQRALLEQVLLVVQRRYVGQVDSRDGQRPAAVQGGQARRDQGPDGREQDRRVERLRRRVRGVLRGRGAQRAG